MPTDFGTLVCAGTMGQNSERLGLYFMVWKLGTHFKAL